MLAFLPARFRRRNLPPMFGSSHALAALRSSPWSVALACSLAACSNAPPLVVLDVSVVTPAGQNPVAGGGFDTATIHMQEGDAAPRVLTAPVAGGSFDFAVSFSQLDPEVALGLELTGPASRLIGAPPPFIPALTGGALAIPVGAPGVCESVAGLALDTDRADLGFARVGTFALMIGGRTNAVPDANGRYLDLLLLSGMTPFSFGAPLGRTRAAAYADDGLIVLGEDRILQLSTDAIPMMLHAGAGPDSGVTERPGGGLAIVGGGTLDAPAAGISYVDTIGTIERLGELSTARFRPTVATVGDQIWVAGGATGSGALVEAIAPGAAATDLVPDSSDGVRLGGALFVDADGARALLIGGVDADGVPRTETWLIRCDTTCTATPGPSWDQARDGVVFVPDARLIAGGDGPSALVERVVFDADGARLEVAGRLAHARAHAAALTLDSGLLWVVGGEDEAGLRRDAELCFPPALLAP